MVCITHTRAEFVKCTIYIIDKTEPALEINILRNVFHFSAVPHEALGSKDQATASQNATWWIGQVTTASYTVKWVVCDTIRVV